MKIKNIKASIILDSRGSKTVKVDIFSDKNRAEASIPSGKSKGFFEAVSLIAEESIKKINYLRPKLKEIDFDSPFDFDKYLIEIDGVENKQNLGANTILALSIAFLRLWSKENNIPLYSAISKLSGIENSVFPRIFVNLINGGLHAKEEFNPLAFQEYLIVPKENSPRLALKSVFEFIEILKGAVCQFQSGLIEGDEGGFILSGDDPEIGFKILNETLLIVDDKIKIDFALDAAASSFFTTEGQPTVEEYSKKGFYLWREQKWSRKELMNLYLKIIENYPLISIEDPFSENDWEGWRILSSKFKVQNSKFLIVGDDLTVTNPKRIKLAKQKEACNAIIIKPNQIGTIFETIEAVKLAKSFGFKTIVSHRSGETNDDFIADLAFGLGVDGLKAGSPIQMERLVKYERLIQIEEEIKIN